MVLPRGHARVRTKLTYLDGSGIDLFVEAPANPGGGGTLTDFGHSLAKLAEYGIAVARVGDLLAEAAHGTPVRRRGDQFVHAVGAVGELPQAIIDLGQVCSRVSCVAFTRPRPAVADQYPDASSRATA